MAHVKPQAIGVPPLIEEDFVRISKAAFDEWTVSNILLRDRIDTLERQLKMERDMSAMRAELDAAYAALHVAERQLYLIENPPPLPAVKPPEQGSMISTDPPAPVPRTVTAYARQ